MRKLLYLSFIFLIFACRENTATDEASVVAEGGDMVTRSMTGDSYVYPVIDWSAYRTNAEKVAACEMPDSILSGISTERLVEACMNYPMLFDAYAFDSPLQGLRIVASRFNGFRELMSRNDNCKFVFKYLKDNDVRNINFTSLTSVEEGDLMLRYSLCEYFLSFEEVLKNANPELAQEIVTFAREVLNGKESAIEHHALLGLSSSTYLLASTLAGGKTQTRAAGTTTLAKFLEDGVLTNMASYQEVKNACRAME